MRHTYTELHKTYRISLQQNRLSMETRKYAQILEIMGKQFETS